MLGDKMSEVGSFFHSCLEHALKAVTVLEVLFQHVNNGPFLLAHDCLQHGHLVFDVLQVGELGV